jgi:ABC-type transport system involved in multi-copper enzyme maturation permease subunit
MDAPAAKRPVTFNRMLPYWAVFQADMQQTVRSWGYRAWVSASVLATVGYLLYRVGLAHEAGIVQPASRLISDLLTWSALASVGLIVVLTAGTISSERGSLADSVLSRGISRYQYFLGKWHSRLVVVLGTFLALGAAALIASLFCLHEDLSAGGSVMALLTVAALLGVVITAGVTVSAICNSTLLGISILWVLLYGGGLALSLLPARYPSPLRALAALPFVLRGYYDAEALGQLIGASAAVCLVTSAVGLVHFSRRDI